MGILKAGSLSIFDNEFNLQKKSLSKFGSAKIAYICIIYIFMKALLLITPLLVIHRG
jgi:hypothetical protein